MRKQHDPIDQLRDVLMKQDMTEAEKSVKWKKLQKEFKEHYKMKGKAKEALVDAVGHEQVALRGRIAARGRVDLSTE